MVLLGAGASMDAEVPDAHGMAERMVNKFYEDVDLLR